MTPVLFVYGCGCARWTPMLLPLAPTGHRCMCTACLRKHGIG